MNITFYLSHDDKVSAATANSLKKKLVTQISQAYSNTNFQVVAKTILVQRSLKFVSLNVFLIGIFDNVNI